MSQYITWSTPFKISAWPYQVLDHIILTDSLQIRLAWLWFSFFFHALRWPLIFWIFFVVSHKISIRLLDLFMLQFHLTLISIFFMHFWYVWYPLFPSPSCHKLQATGLFYIIFIFRDILLIVEISSLHSFSNYFPMHFS